MEGTVVERAVEAVEHRLHDVVEEGALAGLGPAGLAEFLSLVREEQRRTDETPYDTDLPLAPAILTS